MDPDTPPTLPASPPASSIAPPNCQGPSQASQGTSLGKRHHECLHNCGEKEMECPVKRQEREQEQNDHPGPDEHGRTVLHHAASHSNSTLLLEALRRNQFNVDVQDRLGMTPLHIAARDGRNVCLYYLLCAGGNPSVVDYLSATPLHLSARNGSTRCLQLLLASGRAETKDFLSTEQYAEPNFESLFAVAHPPVDVEQGDRHNRTALHFAARGGHLDCLRLLLDSGHANVNARKDDGATSLHLASREGCVLCVQELIRHGADVNLRKETQGTPLHAASRNGHAKCVRQLIEAGCEVDARDLGNRTPLHLAARNGHAACIALLTDFGANVYAQTGAEASALHLASRFGHAECVVELLKKGAQIEWRNTFQATPLHLAALYGEFQCLKVLLEHGAMVDAETADSMTALILVARRSYWGCFRELIHHNAQINCMVAKDQTLFRYLVDEGNWTGVEIALSGPMCIDFSLDTNREALHTLATKLAPYEPETPTRQWNFSDFFNQNLFSDVTIVVEDRRFPAHRVLLCAQSEYFRAMLMGHFRERHEDEIVLHNVANSESFGAFLRFVYTGELMLPPPSQNENTSTTPSKRAFPPQVQWLWDLSHVARVLLCRDMSRAVELKLCESVHDAHLIPMYERSCEEGLTTLRLCCCHYFLRNLDHLLKDHERKTQEMSCFIHDIFPR